MFSGAFALRIFEGFSVQRWNDRVRPLDLTEMDKSAHKMALAYFIGKIEENKGHVIDWEKIIYAGFFDLLAKVILSDIKEPVYRRVKETYPEEFKRLNNWMVDQYIGVIDDEELLGRFRAYVTEDEDLSDINFRVLRAAHRYSTLREFELVKIVNPDSAQLRSTEKDIYDDIESYRDLEGVAQLLDKGNLYELMLYIEQLRNQVRWSQTPRIPETSVLGHSLLVACFSLLVSRELRPAATRARVVNNFFGGLLHDLPECVTRDIISPVKSSTEAFSSIIKTIEDEIVSEELYPLMDENVKREIQYFTTEEFTNRVMVDGKIRFVAFADYEKYNSDEFAPVDGEVIKLCDELAAFLEAYQSMQHGIRSPHLENGAGAVLRKYTRDKLTVYGIEVQPFFADLGITDVVLP